VSYAYIGTRVALAETHSNEGSTRSKNVGVLFSSRLIVFSHYHIDARRVVEAKLGNSEGLGMTISTVCVHQSA